MDDLGQLEGSADAVGCVSELPAGLAPGGTIDLELAYLPASERQTLYRLSIPQGYNSSSAWPLLVAFHGWGGDHRSSSLAPFHSHGKAHGYIVATPRGFHDLDQMGYASWNGAGTTQSPGPQGPICYDEAGRFPYCYDSCRDRDGDCADTCWWTTCEDSVAQVVALLDELEALVCYDARRVYAAGVSNGGVFTYELAQDARTAARFAAFMPIVGSPHRGFNRGPARPPARFFGIWGAEDDIMPARAAESLPPALAGAADASTLAFDTHWGGWLFSSARNTTALWAAAAGCAGAAPAPLQGANASWAAAWQLDAAAAGTQCVGWTACAEGVQVVECLHPGGHAVPDWAPSALHSFVSGGGAPPAPAGGAHRLGLVLPMLLVSAMLAGCSWWGLKSYLRARKQMRKGAKLHDDPPAAAGAAAPGAAPRVAAPDGSGQQQPSLQPTGRSANGGASAIKHHHSIVPARRAPVAPAASTATGTRPLPVAEAEVDFTLELVARPPAAGVPAAAAAQQ